MPDVTINGAEGRLEGKFAPASAGDRAPIALLLHPHPQHGGTMHNKVVYTLNLAFQKAGFSTLRFNFRGVGRSQGSYGRGEGELQDAASALDWIQQNLPNSRGCWIAGFSFGAWIGMQLLMRRPEIDGFVAVAPPANHYDLSFLAPCPASGIIIAGDKDVVAPPQDIDRSLTKVRVQKGEVIERANVPSANHFFQGKLDDLEKTAAVYLKKRMKAFEKAQEEAAKAKAVKDAAKLAPPPKQG